MTDEAKALVYRMRNLQVLEYPQDRIRCADLIETQAREIARLREALRNIRALATKRQNVWGPDGCLTDIECFASAALAGDRHD